MKTLIFCLVLITMSSCSFKDKPVEVDGKAAPKGFVEKESTQTVSDSILAWAATTAKVEGLRQLKVLYPKIKFTQKESWLGEPKVVLVSDTSNTSDDSKWFFIFKSEKGYYIRMVVDEYKQVTKLDVGPEPTK